MPSTQMAKRLQQRAHKKNSRTQFFQIFVFIDIWSYRHKKGKKKDFCVFFFHSNQWTVFCVSHEIDDIKTDKFWFREMITGYLRSIILYPGLFYFYFFVLLLQKRVRIYSDTHITDVRFTFDALLCTAHSALFVVCAHHIATKWIKTKKEMPKILSIV